MNQILSIENTKKEKKKRDKNRGPADIESILKFFSIALIVFGIFMVGSGSYSMYKDSQEETASNKPTISVATLTEGQVTLTIEHSRTLSKVTYKWNDEEEIPIDCNGKRKVEQTIEIPTGTNTLKVYAQDINGQENDCENIYTREGDITLDVTKQEDGNNIIISATGKSELSYLTYRWDEEEETRIDINNTQIEQEIEVIKGTHTLTVIVVDVNNNTETKEIEVQGVTKPKLEVAPDASGNNFVVTMSDEQGLEKVEFIINETKKYRVMLDGKTEHEFSYPLEEGENKLNVTVYNTSGVTENRKVKITK